MIEYNVFWKNFLIGKLYQNEIGKYRFVENIQEKEKAISNGMVNYFLPTSTDKFVSIPFFEKRLKENYQNLDIIKYHTDNFKIQRIY